LGVHVCWHWHFLVSSRVSWSQVLVVGLYTSFLHFWLSPWRVACALQQFWSLQVHPGLRVCTHFPVLRSQESAVQPIPSSQVLVKCWQITPLSVVTHLGLSQAFAGTQLLMSQTGGGVHGRPVIGTTWQVEVTVLYTACWQLSARLALADCAWQQAVLLQVHPGMVVCTHFPLVRSQESAVQATPSSQLTG
jgi:hypothetical protein